MDLIGQVWNGVSKLKFFLVWNRVKIWKTGRHTPTKNSQEYPGVQLVKYPSWWSPDRTPTARPPESPSAPQAYQCKIIQSTGMATEMQLKFYLERNRKQKGRIL